MSPSFDFPFFNAGQLISALPSLKKSKRGWEIFKKVSFFVKLILIILGAWANEQKAPPMGGKIWLVERIFLTWLILPRADSAPMTARGKN